MPQTPDKDDPRALLRKALWYKVYAIVFALTGLFVFAYIYFNFIQINLYEALQDPKVVFLFALPFAPGAFLAYRSEKIRRKAYELLKHK